MKLGYKPEFKRPSSFDEVVRDDPFGLLKNLSEKRVSMDVSDKVKENFEEIASFVKQYDRIPRLDSDDFDEQLLAKSYLALIKESPAGKDYCESLLSQHEVNDSIKFSRRQDPRIEIIEKQIDAMKDKRYEDFDDVLADDPLGLLSDVTGQPVQHETWRDAKSRTNSSSADDVVAKVELCRDFFRYEKYFDTINDYLERGHLLAVNISESSAKADIALGDVFVVNGVMSLIAAVYEETSTKANVAGKLQYRVRQILANGSELSPYNTSIKTSFYKSEYPSKRIVALDVIGGDFLTQMIEELKELEAGSTNNVLSGYIYVLATLSKNPRIKEFSQAGNLVKIGYTSVDVHRRIANAENEATYLYAPVRILKTYKCYNFNAKNLEQVLHSILSSHCLNVTIKDKDGKRYRPKEWFTINAATASEIIEHIFAEDINLYYVDPIQGKLKLKP